MKMLNRMLVGTIALFSVFDGAKAWSGPFADETRLGDMFMVMAPAYAFGMTMMEEDYTGSIQFAEVLVSTQLATEGIKALKLEERPNKHDKKSFPSGHAAGAFSGAMFVHKRYGWKPALIPYAMSIVTSYTRIDTKAHYFHDTVAGAALAGLFTWILVDEYMPKGVSVNADTNGVSVGFKTSF